LCGDPCLGGDCGIQAVCDQRAECTNSTPPDISCPPDLRVFCAGAAFSEASGMATATDDCDLNVAIDHEDAETEVNDPPISTLIIDRTWTATNDCELSSQCVQTIEVREPQIQLDIKPGSCPNVIDTRSRGTIRMSILGTPDFDVSAVDVDSLVLFRADDNGSLIAPTSVVLQDTGTPFDGELCGCHRLGGDGIEDLTLKFNNLSVVNALHLNTVPPGATIRLVVYGALTDGCEFTAEDCMFRSGR
jgi:hypothetical protein